MYDLQANQRVEICIAEGSLRWHGTLCSHDGANVTVRLITRPVNLEHFQPGRIVGLILFRNDEMGALTARICSLEESELTLALLPSEPQEENLLMDDWRDCQIGVRYRAVRPGGHVGSWLEAYATRLGMDGMTLRVHFGVCVPKRMEICFTVPGTGEALKFTNRAYSDTGAELVTLDTGEHLRAICRVAEIRMAPYSHAEIDLAFTILLPADKFRLDQFLGHSGRR